VCPELPDGSQLHCPTPELHQVGPALLETHLCPPECQEELEQQVVPAMKEMEGEQDGGRQGVSCNNCTVEISDHLNFLIKHVLNK